MSTHDAHGEGGGATRDPAAVLGERFREAIARLYPQAGTTDPVITPCKSADLGDFQANGAMALAKRVGMKPRDVALALVREVRLDDVAEGLTEGSVAGPGFINIRLKAAALAGSLAALDAPGLGVEAAAPARTIVVDLMGVNLAKQMHVGHLRSPIIGDCLARVFERLGHRVIRQNHVGDWGLPIAMVTARLMTLAAAGRVDLSRVTLDELDDAYKAAQLECQRDSAGLACVRRYGLGPKAEAELEEQVAGATEAFMHARQTLVRLQAKEPATYAVWRRIYDVTMATCLEVCRLLDVRVTEADSAGESSYADELGPLIEDLTARGVAVADQGALIVRLDEPATDEAGTPLWEPIREPCLVRKTDGGYLYATTDIAAVRRRVQRFGAHELFYAIDARQNLHLRQVFASAIKAGYAIHPQTGRPARMAHAAFGSVLGEDGRPFKTRSGESVKLADLLRETFARAGGVLAARNAELAGEEAAGVARAVGIAALKYADLSTDRVKDYVFSFDRMLAFEGNTGPYLLYALVRVRSIFRKAAERGVGESWRGAPFVVSHAGEKQLALTLLRYPGVLRSVAESLEPHRLCAYVYELAGAFSVFFDQCPVLAAGDDATRDARLRLCDLTGRVLADGLGVLGIPAIERM
ncbi:MAG: arginine--tRNA ligase [Planctomycetota bacterium]|nr:arginine--tRNA ligase [Planctomycetota bacterium]